MVSGTHQKPLQGLFRQIAGFALTALTQWVWAGIGDLAFLASSQVLLLLLLIPGRHFKNRCARAKKSHGRFWLLRGLEMVS